jgi:hypothetical protein
MTLEADYAATAHELLAGHLRDDGLDPRVSDAGVRLGVGGLTVEFRVEAIKPAAGSIQLVYWATVGGVKGLEPPQVELDLLGIGDDAHAALVDGVHVFVDQVLPVLRADADRSTAAGVVSVVSISSLTDGRATAWDLMMGPAGVGGDARDDVERAIANLALAQGLIDTLTPFLALVRGHWYKLFLARGRDGEMFGDMKVDGRQVGLTGSFDGAQWPAGSMTVRQFGLVRPANRAIDLETAEFLRSHSPSS